MCFNFNMSISAVLKPKSAFMQIPANADILSLAWQSKCIINLQIHFVNWYQHRTVLPLGKHVAFINESFFPVWLYYSRVELCLSGVSTFSWISTDVLLLREFYKQENNEGKIMPGGHSLHPQGQLCPTGLRRCNSFINSWKHNFS